MSFDEMQLKNFLEQLYQMSGGDVEAQVSMYDVGAALGLDRAEAGAIAEDLIIDGYGELKNLGGGISITKEGLRLLDVDTGETTDGQGESSFLLGEAEVLAADTVEEVEKLVAEIRKAVIENKLDYHGVEELVIDIKTLETQLLSNRPKTAIIREILRSAANQLQEKEPGGAVVNKIRRIIAEN